MKKKIDPEKEKLVREAYENFPEASECLECIGWNYKEFVFTFVDREDGKTHVVGLRDALRGLDAFEKLVKSGKLPGLGLKPDFMNPESLGDWDAWAFDALNQCAIFGSVPYG